MKIKSAVLGIVIVIVLFGGIVTTMAFNMWQTESAKIPARYASGEYAGKYDPSDIRGSYSFQDIYNAFDIPVEVLGKAFGISHTDHLAAFKNKELENIYAELAAQGKEIGTGSVRLFVALYVGLPIDLEEDTYLPQPAVAILNERGHLTGEQSAFIRQHAVDLSSITYKRDSTASEEHNEDEKIVKGNTTFGELLEWGTSKEAIEKILDTKMPAAPGMTVRDFCQEKGISFSTVKEQLQEQISRVQK